MFIQIPKARRFFALLIMGIALFCIWLLVTDRSIMGGKLSETPTPIVITETVTHVMWVDPPPQCTAHRQEGYGEQCKQESSPINWTSSR